MTATARISMARAAPTKRMNRRPMRMRGSQEELRQGVEVELSGPCAGGEPQRVDCRSDGDARGWVPERDAALLMLELKQKGRSRRLTVGADKAYDTKDFVSTVRELNVTPHVTKNENGRRSNLDRRTTRQPGYAISLSRRWLVEKGFGWLKQTGPLRQVKLRGLEKVDWLFVFSCAAHNLIRLPRLIAQQEPARLREQCA